MIRPTPTLIPLYWSISELPRHDPPHLPQRQFSRERGAIHLLELAITLPLTLMLVLAAVDIFNVLRARNALTTAAQASLRCLYPVQGECHAQDVETADVPTFRWWRWADNIDGNTPLFAVNPIVASVLGRRLQVSPEVGILGNINYEQRQQGYELVLSAAAAASFPYFLQSLPRVRLFDPSFLNTSGPNPVVVNHSYAIEGGSLLAAASAGAINITATTSSATVTLTLDTSSLTTGGSSNQGNSTRQGNAANQNWSPGDLCSTISITSPGSYPRCLTGWDTTSAKAPASDNLIPTVLIVEGIAGGSFSVSPPTSPPVVRMIATIGEGPDIDLGGRAFESPGTTANFVPRGASLTEVDALLQSAVNAGDELKTHAQKLVIPIRKNRRAAKVQLRFFIEQNGAIGNVSWRPTSIRLFGPSLSSRTSPLLPCNNGEILSKEELAEDRCSVGVTIGDAVVYASNLRVDPNQAKVVEDLGCFVNIEQAQAAVGDAALGALHPSTTIQCTNKAVTATCPPALSDSGAPINVGVKGDLTRCSATICAGVASEGSTDNSCPHLDHAVCECCQSRLDAMQICPPDTNDVTNVNWTESWTKLPNDYNITFDANECDEANEIPNGYISNHEALATFAKVRFSPPKEIDKVIISPTSSAAAIALLEPRACPNLTTQTHRLCSILPKEPFCKGAIASPITELTQLVNDSLSRLPFPAKLLPLKTTLVGQSPKPTDPVFAAPVLELVYTGTTTPDICSKEPCIKEILSALPSEQSESSNSSKLHLAESVATQALSAVFSRRTGASVVPTHTVSVTTDMASRGSTGAAAPQVRNYTFSGVINVPLLLLMGQPISVSHTESAISEDGWLGD